MKLLHICLYPNVEGETDFYKKFTLTLLHPLPHQHPEPVECGVMSCGVWVYIYNYYVILLYRLEILEVLLMHHVEKTSLHSNFLWSSEHYQPKWCTSSHRYGKLMLFYSRGLCFSHTNTSRFSSLPPSVLPCCRCEAWKPCFHPDWVRFPFDGGECKCVIYTCLVFYHDKAVHTQGRGGGGTACSCSIHRLSCFIHTLVILYHAPLSGRQEAGWHWNKSLIFCFLISFLLPVVSPISLFILHMWLPAC